MRTSSDANTSQSDSNSASVQFQQAIALLQNGDVRTADEKLHDYLKKVPDSKTAPYLIAQIETPLADLFPAENFSIKLTKDVTLSSVAKLYLGNSLAFYGLARYNGIAVPAKVGEGQSIRIPNTAEAMRAVARIAAATPAVQPALAAPVPLISGPGRPRPAERINADEYYKRGLVAFQRQDLDGAISDWDKVLAIDPDYKNAQLCRAQALRLKANLARLRKPATASRR